MDKPQWSEVERNASVCFLRHCPSAFLHHGHGCLLFACHLVSEWLVLVPRPERERGRKKRKEKQSKETIKHLSQELGCSASDGKNPPWYPAYQLALLISTAQEEGNSRRNQLALLPTGTITQVRSFALL